MASPLVSVLMTIYNHEQFLKDSIQSIQSQTLKNWELIAIDNGSTDNSRKILNSFKDRRIKKKYLKKNIGRTNCLNYGLKFTKGKYIAVLDSDDIAIKNRFVDQTKYFENNKEIWLLGSNSYLINEKNKIYNKRNTFRSLKNMRKLLLKNLIPHSTVMYRRELIKRIGNYPKEYIYAQDYAFYLKTFKNYKIEILDKFLVKIRRGHEKSETFRSQRSRTLLGEDLKILIWIYRNFNYNFIELLKFLIQFSKALLKNIIYRAKF